MICVPLTSGLRETFFVGSPDFSLIDEKGRLFSVMEVKHKFDLQSKAHQELYDLVTVKDLGGTGGDIENRSVRQIFNYLLQNG